MKSLSFNVWVIVFVATTLSSFTVTSVGLYILYHFASNIQTLIRGCDEEAKEID